MGRKQNRLCVTARLTKSIKPALLERAHTGPVPSYLRALALIVAAMVCMLSSTLALATGSLSVTKLVDWNGRTPVPSMAFSYTVTGPAGFTSINDTLVDGATDTFTGLPFGDYTITETSPGTGWTITYTVDGSSPQVAGTLSLSGGTITPVTAAPISGSVYADQNSNGAFNLGESGLAGVTITAYGADNVVCGTTTSRDGSGSPSVGAIGSYELTPSCSGPWRLEFVDSLFGLQPSFVGADNGSTTLFIDDNNLTGNSVGFIDAVGFCQDNPKVVTPIYINGDQSGAQSVMASVNYDRTGNAATVAQASQIGSTWGLAYQRDTDVLYASAVVKRHSGLGSLGIAGIYAISDPAGTPSPSNFVDVGALGIDFGTIGSNAARGLPANVVEQNTDAAAYGQAGVIGIGDIDISDDNATLWMVNLNNRSLVSLDVAGGVAPSAAQEFDVLGTAGVPSCTDGVLRPWALKLRGDTGYLGAVCTGENQADAGVAGAGLTLNIARNLVAYVFSFNTSDPMGTFTQELEVPLNYSKEGANDAGVNTDIWMPWRNTYNDALYNGILGQRPTPMLTDLEFGDDDHLILGFADRSGFQIGGLNRQPDNPGAITSFAFPGGGAIGIQIGGDVLKACEDGTGSFILENNGSCGGVSGSGPANSGPGGASFFDARSGINAHREASTGGLAVLPGSGETVYSAMDPETTIFSGGFQWNNTVANGARVAGFQLWNGTEFDVGFGGGGRFGKANGQGDVEILCDQAPNQIGNRVWDDFDQDGIQDPGEPGLNGVEVVLTPVAGGSPTMITTSGDGNYLFQVNPQTAYTVTIPSAPTGYVLSPINAEGNASNDSQIDVRDSDAFDDVGVATINYSSGLAGHNNHSLDFGFFIRPNSTVVINNTAPPSVSLGSTVFGDLNNNGIQDAGELGIPNVRVQVFNDSGVEIQVGADGILGNADDSSGGMLTDVNGNYFFQDLLDGNYQVRIPVSNFMASGALATTPSSSTDIATTANTDATGVDEDDNGIQTAGSATAVVSPMINLADGTETATETNLGGSGGDAQDNANDDNGDMRLDFGFYAPVSLGSTVFSDLNNNGTQDAGEPGVENVLVQLFTSVGVEVPVGPDGILGTADDSVGGMMTDGAGNYHFQNLVSGDYEVRVPVSNFAAVTGALNDLNTSSTDIASSTNTDATGVDEDDNGLQTGGAATIVVTPIINLTAGAETAVETNAGGSGGDALDNADESSGDMRLDLGFYAPVSLGSTVFGDLNNNAIHDAGESGLANVVVQLFSATGVEVPVGPDGILGNADDALGGISTDSSGNYHFQNLVSGDYEVRIPASNFAVGNALQLYQGSSTDIPSTANTDATGIDEDDNGLQIGGPGTQVVSPIVNLTAGNENAVETNVGGSGGDILDNTNESNGDMRLDFGFFQAVSLGSTVFNDVNNNGTQDSGESGLIGVNVRLFNDLGIEIEVGPDGMLGTLDDSTGGVLTSANGNYYFDGLPPGDYQVRLPVSNFATGNGLAATPSSSTDIVTTPNTDGSAVDEDDNGLQVGGSASAVVSPIINLTAGAETGLETNLGGSGGDAQDNAIENNGDMRLDFGFYDPVSLGSTVFNDANNNGVQDPTETGIANVNIQLFTSAGAEVLVGADGILGTADDAVGGMFTNGSGHYHFQNLVSGDYEVRIPSSNFTGANALENMGTSSTDLTTTANTNGSGVDEDDNGLQPGGSGTAVVSPTITLTAGAETAAESNVGLSGGDALDNADENSGDMRLDFGFYAPVSLGSTVFADANNNGLHDAGERGLANVVVQLFDNTNAEVPVGPDGILGTLDDAIGGVTTNINGNYHFQNLTGGDYEVRIPVSNFDTGNALASYLGSSTDIVSTPNTDASGVDEDDNGLQAGGPGTQVVSPIINLTAGAETGAETNNGSSGGDALDNGNENNGDMRLDFGFFQTVSLGSTVFSDINNNAIQDSSETGLGNVVVQLFDGAGGEVLVGADGMLGSSDDGAGGVLTDANGNYYFDGLPPGDYRVRIPDANFSVGNGLNNLPSSSTDIATTASTDASGIDEDDNGLQPNGSGTQVESPIINLTAGAETAPETDVGGSGGNAQDDANEANGDMRLDFGFYDPVSLGSTVFNDADNNGLHELGESGVQNVVVQLFANSGAEIPVGPDGILGTADDTLGGVQTDSNGNYHFQNLVSGDYQVRVPISNFAVTGALQGLPTSSSDIVTTPNTDNSGVDEDDNGLQAGGSGTIVTTPIINLTAGAEANVETDLGGSGGEALDNADENSGDMRLDLGFYTPVSVGSTVFADVNNNAMHDATEVGIANVVVQLFTDSGVEIPVGPDGILGSLDDALGGVVTDGNGNYHFQNLVTGDYQVRIPISNFTGGGALMVNTGSSSDIVSTTSTDATGLDEDDNGIQAGGFGTEVVSPVINLTANAETNAETDAGGSGGNVQDDSAETSGDMRLDFGFFAPVSLGSTVFNDINNDGQQAAGELGIANVVVELLNAAGAEVLVGSDGILGTIDDASGGMLTDASGNYFFQSLPPGDYQVRLPISNFTTGGALQVLASSSTDISTTPNTDAAGVDEDDNGLQVAGSGTQVLTPIVTLTDNGEVGLETNVGGSGGNAQDDVDDDNGDMRLDLGFYAPVSLGSTVFGDLNNNGLHEAGESGIENVTVQLFSSTGVEIPVGPDGILGSADDALGGVLTDGNGNYHFQNLVSGDYQVRVPVSNFVGGGALVAASTSSTDITTTANTDASGIDEDDNGIQAGGSGFAVVTPTINLTAGAETAVETNAAGSGGDALDNANESSGDMRLDLGFYAPVSLGSTVFNDVNNDGMQNVGETGIANVRVRLFTASGVEIPVGADGVLGTLDDAVGGTLTDGDGNYYFQNLVSDDYQVSIPLTNFTVGNALNEFPSSSADISTTPNTDNTGVDEDDNGLQTAGIGTEVVSSIVNLAAGAEINPETDTAGSGGAAQDDAAETNGDMRLDFGFFQPVSLGSVVFEDDNQNAVVDTTDGDGVQQADELGINGAIVSLFTSTGRPVIVDTNGVYTADQSGANNSVVTSNSWNGPTGAVTVPDGSYNFSGLPAGDYIIRVEPGVVFAPSPVQNATVDTRNLDSNLDLNRVTVHGTWESGVIALVANSTPNGELDANGVAEVDPSGINQFDDQSSDLTVDFGFVQSVAIGNTVWLDNGVGNGDANDGILNGSEVGINGVTVELYRRGDLAGTDAPVATQLTDSQGHYLFTLLTPDTYFVHIPESNFVANGPLVGLTSSAPEGGDTQDDDDSDENGINTRVAGGVSSSDIQLLVGAEPVGESGNNDNLPNPQLDDSTDSTVDFGFVPMQVGSIGNYVWLDENSNGEQDAGESGISNIVIELKDAAGTVIATTVTDANGGYLFSDLVANDYIVDVQDASLPSNLTQTTIFTNTVDGADVDNVDDDGDFGNKDHAGMGYPITLDDGEDNRTADFGYNWNTTDEVNNNNGLAALGDRVWIDANGNGVQEMSEVPVAGVEVSLFTDPDGDGVFDAPYAPNPGQLTDANGRYLFDDLPVGAYVVTVTDSVAASHDVLDAALFSQTGDPDHFAADRLTAQAGQASDNSSSSAIVLSVGDVFINADFGYQPNTLSDLGSIGDTVWLDADSDGSGPLIDSIDGINNPSIGQGNDAQSDDGEPFIKGVSVALIADINGNSFIDAGEPIIATDITDENGQYLFEGLPLGEDYIVSITDTDSVLANLTPTYDHNGASGTPNMSAVPALAGDDREQDFGYTSDDSENVDDGPIGSIGDTVWGDLDGSGGDQSTQANEPGLANVVVHLFVDEDGVAGPDDLNQDSIIDVNDALVSTTTDGNGRYLFTGLPLTTYIIGVDDTTLPAGFSAASTYLPQGGGIENDVNTLNDLSDPISLTASVPANRNQDFSYPVIIGNAGSGVIGDTIWGDTDSDGNGPFGAGDGSDVNEPLFADVVVRLFDDNGELLATQTTNTDGAYLFTGLDPLASYSVLVDSSTLPSGYASTPTGDPEGDGNNASLVNLNNGSLGVEDGVNDPDGENGQNLGQDFGYPPVIVPPADVVGSIGDTIWFDVDVSGGNQTTQGAEPGLAGVSISLTPPAGVDIGAGAGSPISTVTDENGEYLFINLPLDAAGASREYTVTLDASTLPNYVSESPTHDPEGDGNNSALVGLSNTTPDDREQDFSYPPAVQTASIGDTIFLDNGDNIGAQDDEDTLIEGVLVNLLLDTDGDGTPELQAGSQVTNQNGQYLFTGLNPESVYGVEVDANNFNANGPLQGTSNSVDPDGGNDNESVVDLSAVDGNADEDGPNNINRGQDFGYSANAPVDVGNLVWLDRDADGVYEANGLDAIAGTDDDETPIAGVTVEIFRDLDGNGEVDFNEPLMGQTVTTNAVDVSEFGADGNYLFANLPADNYVVKVTDQDDILTGYWHSEGADQRADNHSKTESYTVDATLGDNLTADFGYYVEPGSVGDVLWEDLNGNGLYDPDTEPGIDNVMVEFTIEYPDGSTIELVDTTEFGGVYRFDNLNLDEDFDGIATITYGNGGDEPSHTVALNVATTPEHLIPIYTFDINPQNTDSTTVGGGTSDQDDTDQGGDDGVNGEFAFPPMGSVDDTNDFGFAEGGSIGNYVWLDFDMDGIQDANEDGIAGVTVNLLEDTNGNGIIDGVELTIPVVSAITGPNGEYLFPRLTPGRVYITQVDSVTVPTGFVQTYDEGLTPGSVGRLDHTSAPIVLSPGEEHLTADFGYVPPAGSLGDTIWVDSNDNGLQDPGETGLPNITISIQPAPSVDLGAGSGVAITTTTDENGKYLFTDLPLNETYIVTVQSGIPPEYMLSESGLGDPDVRDGNSEPSAADGVTYVLLTTDDPVNLDADFGYVPNDSVNNSISGTVWRDNDEDGNGPQGVGDGSDNAEGPIPSVTVSLIRDNGDGVYNPVDDPVIGTTITDPTGRYEFTGLPDGDYFVLVTDQSNVLSGLEQTVDSDDPAAPGTFTPITPNLSFVDDLGVGIATPAVNDEQDFGYVEPSNTDGDGSIGDTIFFDANNSGLPEPGEGIEGVVVQLFGPGPDGIIGNTDDVLIASETTDENGNYLFTGLGTSNTGIDAGTDYRVVVLTDSLPNGGSGWENSVDPDSPNVGDSVSTVTLTPTEPSNVDQDFGYSSNDNNTIRGTVWPDTNGDGMLVEAGRFEGVTIELRDQDGNVIQTTDTDINGNFEFTNLPDGIYTVVVTDDDNVLSGFEHTDSPNGLTDNRDNTSKDDTGYVVDLDSVGANPDPVTDGTSDFGYEPVVTNPISLGAFLAQEQGDTVAFKWQTQTEVANLGFYLYALIEGDWERLNDQLIIGQGDSVHAQSYIFTAPSDATVFALSDIDFQGKETLHGPFVLGQPYGVMSERHSIDWGAERAERETKKVKRKRLKEQQQDRRIRELIQRALRQSSVPNNGEPLAPTQVNDLTEEAA